MAVQIIQIWRQKQNVGQKTCHAWISLSPEQKMVEKSFKKYQNKEELDNMTVFIWLR